MKLLPFPSLLLTVTMLSTSLAACAAPAPTATPNLTRTPIPATATEAPISTPTATETQQSEAGHIKWERVEANREAVNDYLFVKIVFGLNEGKPYFIENNIKTEDDLRNFLKKNGGFFPASKNNSLLTFIGSTDELLLKKIGIKMDKKLKANLTIQIVNPDEIDTTTIFGGKVQPWILKPGLEGTPKERSVSIGISVNQSDGQNEIVLQLVWKNGKYNLFGDILLTPNIPTPEMTKQADGLIKSMLISGYLLSQPDVWIEQHKQIMMGDDLVKLNVIFNAMRDGKELQLGIDNYPPQIIQ